MAETPYLKWFCNDWLSSRAKAVMTLEQQAAYRNLIDHCWMSGDCSLPDDDDILAALSGMNEGWFKGGSTVVRRWFMPHPEKEGHLTNGRTWAAWQERLEWSEKSRQGGIKSGEARRKVKPKGGSRVVEPNANQTATSHSHSSESEEKEKNTQKRNTYSDDFARFWAAFPTGRKKGKQKAYASWKRAIKLATAEDIIKAAEAYAGSEEGRSEFVCMPTTWLNQGRYEDDPSEWGTPEKKVNQVPSEETLRNWRP